MSGVLFALALRSLAVPAATGTAMLETDLAWAQMMAETPGDTVRDEAWGSHWRNEAGRYASELILTQLEKKPARPEEREGVAAPAAPADPNARFRAAATPEENLSRAPAPKVTTENDYIPKLRPGETAGVSVDYARIESVINRHAQEPSSTVAVIPPLVNYGVVVPFGGYGWHTPRWGGWGGVAWDGRGGWWGGRRGYWAPPCVLAAPVYYDPYCGGGISGGFFYRSRHFGIGVRF